MTKKFVYQVEGFEFTDTQAFGTAWKDAKAKASEMHSPIYRLVIKNGETRQEVFYKSGCFNTTEYATADNVAIF